MIKSHFSYKVQLKLLLEKKELEQKALNITKGQYLRIQQFLMIHKSEKYKINSNLLILMRELHYLLEDVIYKKC